MAMNRRDFLEWLNYHSLCLPSFGSWFKSHHDPDTLLTAWVKAMADVELADAMAGTDAIVAGDIDRPFPEDTAAVVRKFALARVAGRRNTEPEPDESARSCPLCRGSGMVSIWHPLVARAVREGVTSFESPGGAIYSVATADGDIKATRAAVPCKCSLGDRYAGWMRKEGDRWIRHAMPRYGDSVNYVPVVFRSGADRQRPVRDRVKDDIAARKSIAVEWEIAEF